MCILDYGIVRVLVGFNILFSSLISFCFLISKHESKAFILKKKSYLKGEWMRNTIKQRHREKERGTERERERGGGGGRDSERGKIYKTDLAKTLNPR